MNLRHLLPLVLIATGCRAPTPTFDPFAVYGSKRIPPPSTGTVGPGDTYYQPSNPTAPGSYQPAPELPASPPPSLDSGGIPGNQTSSWEARDGLTQQVEIATVSAEEETSDDGLTEAANLVWNNPEPQGKVTPPTGNPLRFAGNSRRQSESSRSQREVATDASMSETGGGKSTSNQNDLIEITDFPPVLAPRPFRPFTVRGQTPTRIGSNARRIRHIQSQSAAPTDSTSAATTRQDKRPSNSGLPEVAGKSTSELQWRKPEDPSRYK